MNLNKKISFPIAIILIIAIGIFFYFIIVSRYKQALETRYENFYNLEY